MAPYSSSCIIQMSQNPKLIWKGVIYILYKAEIFNVAAKLKVWACTPFEVAAPAWLHVKGLKKDLFKSVQEFRASGALDYARWAV